MRKLGLLLALFAVLGSSVAVADHFDADPATGSFNPQLSVAISSNVVDRPSTITLDITQQDHEDPPVYSWLRSPLDWQFAFATTRPAEKVGGLPATSCEDALDNHGNSPAGTGSGTNIDYSKRTDATLVRGEKIGTALLRIHATGFTRPGESARWDGDVFFRSYSPGSPPAIPPAAQLCLFLKTQDTRITTIPDIPGNSYDDIENVTELVVGFTMEATESSWEIEVDLSDIVKDPTFQSPSPNNPPSPSNPAGVDLSLIQLKSEIFGTSAGNWNTGGALAFSRAPHVSGNKVFQGHFQTCPADDPAYGGCKSGRPDVVHTFNKAVILPAPTITAPAPGTTDNDGTVTIGGNADPLASVQVYENGSPLGVPATASASGAWGTDLAFTEGNHTVVARTVDAGGVSADSNPRAFSVDVPPASPSVNEPSSGQIVGAGSIPVSGAAQPGSTVKVYEGGTLLSQTTAQSPSGAWSTTVFLTDKGPHTLTATSTDGGGASGATPFVFDVTTAVPVIAAPAQGGAFKVQTVGLSGTAEPGSTVKIYEDAAEITSAVADGDGNWSVDHTFSEATHTITATATSLDTLVSPPTPPRTFAVDLTAPDKPVISTPQENQEVGNATLVFTGTSEPNAKITIREAGNQVAQGFANGSGNWSIPAQLSIATHTVTAEAEDLAGNLSLPSDPRTIVVVQSILINTPDEGTWQPRSVLVSGFSDPSSQEVVVYEGTAERGRTAVVGGSWSKTILFPSDGQHSITARSVINGVLSPPSSVRTFKVDGTGPALVVQKPASNGVAYMLPGDKITGSATDAGSGVKSIAISYFNAAGQFVRGQSATCTGCGTGSATFEADPNVGPGVFGVQIRAIDAVDNGSSLVQLILVIF